MVKEESKTKQEDEKFPPWEVINYCLQIEKYFSIVRKLHNKGLKPKTDLTNVHVCDDNLIEVFGPKCNYKLTNPFIHANIKCELTKLHWQIYGSTTPTNNDFHVMVGEGVHSTRERNQD
jgi:hypothetical protein